MAVRSDCAPRKCLIVACFNSEYGVCVHLSFKWNVELSLRQNAYSLSQFIRKVTHEEDPDGPRCCRPLGGFSQGASAGLRPTRLRRCCGWRYYRRRHCRRRDRLLALRLRARLWLLWSGSLLRTGIRLLRTRLCRRSRLRLAAPAVLGWLRLAVPQRQGLRLTTFIVL